MFVEFQGREFPKITKRFNETQRFNESFQRFFCSFEMVCKSSVCSFHWLRFIVFGFLRGYESIVHEVLMVGHWLFHFEGAGLMCTSPLGCCEWMFPFTLESTSVLTRVSFKSQNMFFCYLKLNLTKSLP